MCFQVNMCFQVDNFSKLCLQVNMCFQVDDFSKLCFQVNYYIEWPHVWKSDSDGIQNGMNKSNDNMCMIFNVHVDQFCNDPGSKVIRL